MIRKYIIYLLFSLLFFNSLNAKTLIVYFSLTGNTRKVANYIKEYTKADIFEIVPTELYSKNSQVASDRNLEEYEENKNVGIKTKIKNIDEYDNIIIGFPIWSGKEPQIIRSFLYQNNVNGKTVIPFCTTAFTSIDKSIEDIKNIIPNSTILQSIEIRSSNIDNSITNINRWLNNIGIKN